MAITIRFQGGPSAGQVVAFDDLKQRITLGRDPARCDVVFPAGETQVGREHCALVRELGRYRLALNQDNLVLVNGQPAIDEQELPPAADVQLGPGGPKLVVETLHDRSLPSTAYQGERPGQPTMIRSAGQAARTGRRVAMLAVLLLIAGGVVAYRALHEQDAEVQQVGQKADAAGQKADTAGQQAGSAEQKAGEAQRKATQAERKATEAKTQIALITPKVESLKELTDEQKKILAHVATEVTLVEKKLKDAEPRLDAMVRKASASVYLVLLRDVDGREYPQATAWVADKSKGIMATNGHVAEIFPRPWAGGKLLVRSNSASKTPAKTFVVKSITIHPGYEEFQRMWRVYDPTARRSALSVEAIHSAGPACDVALLHLENKEGLDESLLLAPPEVLDGVGPTYPVGYAGYPMEGLAIGGVNPKSPTPTRHLAYVSAVTDYFGDSNVATKERMLVHHALPAAGGASGSPIVNRDGQVVAVLNAGNMIGLTPTARIASSVNIAFAQRADLVRELLDGTAMAKQPARLARWRQDLARNFQQRNDVEPEVKGLRDRVANGTVTDWKDAQPASADYTIRFHSLADRQLWADPISKTELKLHSGGPCFAIAYAVADDVPLTLRAVENFKGTTQTVEGEATNFRWARVLKMDVREGADLKITVSIGADTRQTKIILKVLQALRTRIPPDKRLDQVLSEWKKKISPLVGPPAETELVSETSGKLPDPLVEGSSAISKVDVELRDAGDYFVFISTPGDDKLGMLVARQDGWRLEDLAADKRKAPTAFGSFKVVAGTKITIFVTGEAKDVPFNLKLFRRVENAEPASPSPAKS